MWHNKYIESLFVIGSFIIILIGGILCGVAKPEGPAVFPYALEYPVDILYSEANLNAIDIRSELTQKNKQGFKVYGI